MTNRSEQYPPGSHDQATRRARQLADRRALLTNIDPSNPLSLLREVDQLIEEAKRAQDQEGMMGYEAVQAFLLDEVARHKLLRHLKRAATPAPVDEFRDALQAYERLLPRTADLPNHISDHVTISDIWCRISDLLANKQWYTDTSPTQEELERAKAALWNAYLTVKDIGKRVELALIGLLRYGLYPRNIEVDLRIETQGQMPAMTSGELQKRLEDPKSLEPVLLIQHTMPREDQSHNGPFAGCDLWWLLPGEKEGRGYQLKTEHAPGEETLHLIRLNAERVIRTWEMIGEPKRHPSKEALIEWGRDYELVIRSIADQLPPKVEARFRKTVWPYLHRLHKGLPPRAETVSNPFLDRLFSFANLIKHWSKLQTVVPKLQGTTLGLQNYSHIKSELVAAYDQDPTSSVWSTLSKTMK